MDRRDFFKSILLTPLLTPLLLASKTSSSDAELYLISDSPQICLPPLLQELKSLGLVSGNSFSLSLQTPMPHQDQIRRALTTSGWRAVSAGTGAQMTLTSSRLHSPARPSFSLAREGTVWDLRTRGLRSLWKDMHNQKLANTLTIAAFHARPTELIAGKAVSLYSGGQKVKTVSLGENASHSFRTKNGQINVKVKDGKAWVEESSCRHKICTHCPPALYAGERIICAPNHFMLSIDGPSSIDTIIG